MRTYSTQCPLFTWPRALIPAPFLIRATPAERIHGKKAGGPASGFTIFLADLGLGEELATKQSGQTNNASSKHHERARLRSAHRLGEVE